MIDKYINQKFHFPSVKVNAVLALPLIGCAVVFFPSFYADLHIFALLVAGILILTLANVSQLRTPRNITSILLVMFFLILVMVYSYNSSPIITFEVIETTSSAYVPNILLSSLICFSVFIIGYAYGYLFENAFGILRYVFTFQLLLAYLYITVTHGLSIEYSQFQGILPVVLLPFIYLILSDKSNSLQFFYTLLLLSYLSLIGARTSLLAVVMFMVTYFCYPYICRRYSMYKLYFFCFILLFISLQYLYISGFFGFLDEFTRSIFGKSINSGRNFIWVELLQYISEKPYFGYGTNQSSSYLVSSYANWRNLSSHNLYLEILLRGGLLQLTLLMCIFYMLWKSFHSYADNKFGRIGASGFIAILFFRRRCELLHRVHDVSRGDGERSVESRAGLSARRSCRTPGQWACLVVLGGCSWKYMDVE